MTHQQADISIMIQVNDEKINTLPLLSNLPETKVWAQSAGERISFSRVELDLLNNNYFRLERVANRRYWRLRLQKDISMPLAGSHNLRFRVNYDGKIYLVECKLTVRLPLHLVTAGEGVPRQKNDILNPLTVWVKNLSGVTENVSPERLAQDVTNPPFVCDTLWIYGGLACGKTTFLRATVEQLKQLGWHIIDITTKVRGLPNLSDDNKKFIVTQVSQAQVANIKRVAIVCDELDCIFTKYMPIGGAKDLLKTIREQMNFLSQKDIRPLLVIADYLPPEVRLDIKGTPDESPDWRHSFQVCACQVPSRLTEDQIEGLVAQLPQVAKAEIKAISDRLYILTRGQPLLVNSLLHHILSMNLNTDKEPLKIIQYEDLGSSDIVFQAATCLARKTRKDFESIESDFPTGSEEIQRLTNEEDELFRKLAIQPRVLIQDADKEAFRRLKWKGLAEDVTPQNDSWGRVDIPLLRALLLDQLKAPAIID